MFFRDISKIYLQLQLFLISGIMLSAIVYYFCLLLLCGELGHTLVPQTAQPSWTTSNYFRAGNQNVIKTLTGNTTTPQHNFHFSSPLPAIPKLAYGVKNYRGTDFFSTEGFEIRRVDLTEATFRVAVQIIGFTNILQLNVAYIAIDPTFPHHLNSFDNVPINYDNGPLSNITEKKINQIQTYTNVINYTTQAAGMQYNRFSPPFENNRIILYMVATHIYGTFAPYYGPQYPIDIHVNGNVLSQQTYQLKVSLETNVLMYLLHFSIIIFDEKDVESSHKYFIVTEYYDWTKAGGFIPIPLQFQDNFILGLTDFSTLRCRAILTYNWEFTTVSNGTFGVLVEESIASKNSISEQALSRQGTIVFYIKTWGCPTGYPYFNLTTNLCQDTCGHYYIKNQLKNSCEKCRNSCLECSFEDGYTCLTCDENTDKRQLRGNKLCSCISGYYDVDGSTICQPCENIISGCIDCFHNTTFQSADAPSGALQFGCFQCSPGKFLSNNMCVSSITCPGETFLDQQVNTCKPCPLEGCLNCHSLTQCQVCDRSIQKFLNTETKQCETCMIQYCAVCFSIHGCSACKDTFILKDNTCICESQGSYLDNADEKCISCSPYCKSCIGLTSYECTSCFEEQNRTLIGGQCKCTKFNMKEPSSEMSTLQCQVIDEKICEPGYLYISNHQKCIQFCGDGIALDLECDDGNIVDGDGCSSQCEIQQGYQCRFSKGQISVCRFTSQIEITDMLITKQNQKNSLYFDLVISPHSLLFNNYNFTQILQFQGAPITINQAIYKNGKLLISADYFDDLVHQQISLHVKQSEYFNPSIKQNSQETLFNTSKATFQIGNVQDSSLLNNSSSRKFKIKPINNLGAYHYSEQEYQAYNISKRIVTGIIIVGLIAVVFTLFLKNSLPTLLIFSNLQICFLGLICVDGLNPVTQGIIHSKPVLGYNGLNITTEKFSNASTMISVLGYGDNFVNNVNFMLFLCIGFMVFTLVFYLVQLKKSSMKTIFKIFQRETMLLIIFSMTGLSFSLDIFMEVRLINIIFGCIFVGITLFQFIHFMIYMENYFGIVCTFDIDKQFKASFIMFLICRLAICLVLAMVQDQQEAIIGVLVCQGAMVLSLLVLRPFLYFFCNILVACGEVLGMAYFVVIFKMSGNKEDDWTSGWIMIGALCSIVGVSLANLGYSIYQDCKRLLLPS